MDYTKKLNYHYKPKSGWVNDPNGLVYYKGYYHVFYQHAPNYEVPWKEPMHWGHARTKDFLSWEEMPIALFPDKNYDEKGCWSGTAIVKDDVLYLFYASIYGVENKQTVSVAYSTDGVNFTKYDGNPIIDNYPSDGSKDFRDPAVCRINGKYYCVMASGHIESKTARLLLYESDDLFGWEYQGIVGQWEDCRYAECPSFIPTNDGYLLSASVCPLNANHYFFIAYGSFYDNKFTSEYISEIDKGPDQYAGQVFKDDAGRTIMISWIPGWKYKGYAEKDVGCMSAPREIKLINGKITGYPIKELQSYLKDEDPVLKRTKDGFIVERTGRDPVVYNGEIRSLKMLRDEYILEVFVNDGEEVYTVLL